MATRSLSIGGGAEITNFARFGHMFMAMKLPSAVILTAVLCSTAFACIALSEPANGQSPKAPNSTAARGATTPIGAQESEDGADLLKRIARSMGRYARDVSEIPLSVESKVSKFDPSGKHKRSKSSSHTMQFKKRYYSEKGVWRQLRASKHGLHRISKDEVNGDSATGVLALIFDNGTVSAAHRYDLIVHLISKRLEIKIADNSPCEAFDPGAMDERKWCGETHLDLDSLTFDPLGASFEAGGFPRTFGDVRYLSFRFVEEFQKVSIPGSKEPFLLPARIVVTYESDRERTVIENTYSVNRRAERPEVRP